MEFPRIAALSLVILATAMIGGWSGIGAEDISYSERPASAEKPVTPAEPSEADLELAKELQPLDLEPSAPELESPPVVEAGCHTEDCGNTGTRWGVGPEPGCNNGARADLNSNIWAAALNICPGVVTGITYHYDNNCSGDGVPSGYCTESGNADVECKVCPGQYCF